MKKLFVAIRHNDLNTVKELLNKKPELISCVAKQPPKKDDGQSPLQVAIKTGAFEIAEFLLDMGADVNFIENESCNNWKIPASHDAIRAAVFSSRFSRSPSYDKANWELCNSKEKSDTSYKLLKRAFDMGADVAARDSSGNSCLHRAIMDARQVLPTYHYGKSKLMDDGLLTDELKEDLMRIFDLLLSKGADVNEVIPNRNASLSEIYAKEPVLRFFAK